MKDNSINIIQAPIKHDLLLVRARLNKIYRQIDHYVTPSVSNFFRLSRGKQIRPAMILLVWRMITNSKKKKPPDNVLHAAVAIELLHIASLIHDDIIDEADTRHGNPAAHVYYGMNRALVLGDDLIAAANQEIALCSNIHIRSSLTNAFRAVMEGQVREMANRRDPTVTAKEYLSIIKRKSSPIFSAAMETGAYAAESPRNAKRCFAIGHHFGISYQILDDVIDILSTKKAAGKPVGNDLREGEMTLPIIYLIREVGNREQALIRSTLKQGLKKNIPHIVKLFRHSRAYLKTKQDVQKHITIAVQTLHRFKPSRYRTGLIVLFKSLEEKLQELK